MENKDLDLSIDENTQDENQENAQGENKPTGNQCNCRRLAFLSSLYDFAEIFALSIIAVILVFSFCIRLCRVDGHSMRNTLEDGERIIAHDIFYTPKQGDIVVFHLVNDNFKRPLVKRVIAVEGQSVEINFTDKKIYVDGVLYEDEHAYYDSGRYVIKVDFDKSCMSGEDGKVYYRTTVPKGKIFVLGDNRNNSTDSRSVTVGFIDEDCVLGKAIVRLKPFTIFD